MQGVLDRRERDVDDGAVQRHHQLCRRDHQQGDGKVLASANTGASLSSGGT
jgi:hypothetical protein